MNSPTEVITIDGIRDILPHRFPMLLIDQVVECSPMNFAKGIKAVSYNEPYFQGHFPQKSVMPGVLIIEALTQLIHFMIASEEQYQDATIFYSQISKAKFYQTVTPGCLLHLEVKKKGCIDNLVMCNTRASVQGVDIFTGEITVVIIPSSISESGEKL